MYSQTPFDAIAAEYDDTFTNSLIGRAQRNIVWEILNVKIGKQRELNILEIGCGTGEDALMLGKNGHHVHAIDISPEMIRQARNKNTFQTVVFENVNLDSFNPNNAKYDLIFSNFGALNCMNSEELKKINQQALGLLKPNGKMILVLIGKYCWMERLYFFLKGDRAGIKRRLKPNTGNLTETSLQSTFCYSTGEMEAIFYNFRIENKQAVGLFIPPSFAEQSLKTHPFVFPFLKGFERIFGRISGLADYGDHVCITLKPREN